MPVQQWEPNLPAHREPEQATVVSGNVELAHRDIDISKELEREYLNGILTGVGGDTANSWLNYRRTGEVRYAINRSAHIAGYANFYAAKVNERGEIIQTKVSGVEADIVSSITSRFGGTRGLIERYYTLMKVPGQGFLTGVRSGLDGTGDLDGYWFLSSSEIGREGDAASRARAREPLTWKMKRTGGSNSTGLSRLIQPQDFYGRVWNPDHEFVEDAASPMQSINGMCEQLHTLTETIAGRLRQRFALAGILLIPNEINDAAISGDKPRDGRYSSDKVMNYLIHVMTTNVVNHAQGIANIPILLKGPAAVLDMVRHLIMDATIAETDLQLRGELIGRILTALDQQQSAVEGMTDMNHFTAWTVGDEERRIAVQPDIENLCHILTRMILWKELKERKRTAGTIMPWRVWFDLSASSVRSNLSEDARQGFDRLAVGPAYLRRQFGATSEDAPTDQEYVRMLGASMKNPILATYGMTGVEAVLERAATWAKTPGPAPDSQGDDPEAGPGEGDPGSPDDRETDIPRTERPA